VSLLATANKGAMVRAFGMTTRPWQDYNFTKSGFPHQRYKSRKPRPTSTKSPNPIILTMNEESCFLTVQNTKCGGKQL